MRDEETRYIKYLKDNAKAFDRPPEGLLDGREFCNNYESVLHDFLNSFSLSKGEVLEILLGDKVLCKLFTEISCYWVCAMAGRFCTDYWDLRDKASVIACKDIFMLPEFTALCEKVCVEVYDLDRALDPRKDDPQIISVTGTAISQLHPTLRQTFTGLALSFLMQRKGITAFQKAALTSGAVKERNVSFFMF